MKKILFISIVVGTVIIVSNMCKNCEDRLDASIPKQRAERLSLSGTQTFIFKHPYGDTPYSTNYVTLGTPQLITGSDYNGKSESNPRWYFVDKFDYILVKDDKFEQNINPTCILVGLKTNKHTISK